MTISVDDYAALRRTVQNYRIWCVPFSPFRARGYSTIIQTNNVYDFYLGDWKPVLNIGPHRLAFVDEPIVFSTERSFKVNEGLGKDSSGDYLGTVHGGVWDFNGGTCPDGTSGAGDKEVSWSTSGLKTVTYTNDGAVATRYVRVLANRSVMHWEVTDIGNLNCNGEGWSASMTIMPDDFGDTMDNLSDYQCIGIFVEDRFGEEERVIGHTYGEPRCVMQGYIREGSIRFDADQHGVSFTIESIGAQMKDLMIHKQQYWASPVDMVQQITLDATGGTFTLEFDGDTSDSLAYDASAATVQSELEELSSIGAGNVRVSGDEGGPYTVRFRNALANDLDLPLIIAHAGSLTGGEERITIEALNTRVAVVDHGGVIMYNVGGADDDDPGQYSQDLKITHGVLYLLQQKTNLLNEHDFYTFWHPSQLQTLGSMTGQEASCWAMLSGWADATFCKLWTNSGNAICFGPDRELTRTDDWERVFPTVIDLDEELLWGVNMTEDKQRNVIYVKLVAVSQITGASRFGEYPDPTPWTEEDPNIDGPPSGPGTWVTKSDLIGNNRSWLEQLAKRFYVTANRKWKGSVTMGLNRSIGIHDKVLLSVPLEDNDTVWDGKAFFVRGLGYEVKPGDGIWKTTLTLEEVLL